MMTNCCVLTLACADELTVHAGLAPDSSLVGMAVPAGMGGVQQAQLQLMLSQQQQRLVQLQALQASLLAELEAAGKTLYPP